MSDTSQHSEAFGGGLAMLWFFDRNDESLVLETRYDTDTSEFVVVVRHPQGEEYTERFSDGDEYRQWLEAYERELRLQRWSARCGPIVLPYGWPHKRVP